MAYIRIIKRYKKRYEIRFGIYSPQRLAFTEDISANGLFIRTANITPVGTRILIDLILPNSDTVSIEGVVRWARNPPQTTTMADKCGMGVEIKLFIAGEASYRKHIAELNSRESKLMSNHVRFISAP
ncbi:pilZ domain protein [Geobacter sp. OR-1]|uniref:PilZ domain-containing protein n=1 Tax=Geobacter sp. OR-1 TaxID=1266765 RepID=UPI00054436F7|nr:PilZ domain-containing protein [Geobacter sp. OR-1]GAM10863.1 pilZ domain protein [Geobacter sp. OR-1]